MCRSSSGIAVKTQRVWGSQGYVKEIPSVAVATPPVSTVTASPRAPQQPVTVLTEVMEGETEEREGESSDRSSDSSSRPITGVSFISLAHQPHGGLHSLS